MGHKRMSHADYDQPVYAVRWTTIKIRAKHIKHEMDKMYFIPKNWPTKQFSNNIHISMITPQYPYILQINVKQSVTIRLSINAS